MNTRTTAPQYFPSSNRFNEESNDRPQNHRKRNIKKPLRSRERDHGQFIPNPISPIPAHGIDGKRITDAFGNTVAINKTNANDAPSSNRADLNQKGKLNSFAKGSFQTTPQGFLDDDFADFESATYSNSTTSGGSGSHSSPLDVDVRRNHYSSASKKHVANGSQAKTTTRRKQVNLQANRPNRLGLVRQVTDGTSALTPSPATMMSMKTPGTGLSSMAVGKSHSQSMKSDRTTPFGYRNTPSGMNLHMEMGMSDKKKALFDRDRSKSSSVQKTRAISDDSIQFDDFFKERQPMSSLITPNSIKVDSDPTDAFFSSDKQQQQPPPHKSSHTCNGDKIGDGNDDLFSSKESPQSTGFDPKNDFIQCTSIEFTTTEDLFANANPFPSSSNRPSNQTGANPIQPPKPDLMHEHDRDHHILTTTEQDFDIYQFNGLMVDDSTIGTALSQRHLLRHDSVSPQKKRNQVVTSSGSIAGIGQADKMKKSKSPLNFFIKSSTPRKLKQRARKSKQKDPIETETQTPQDQTQTPSSPSRSQSKLKHRLTTGSARKRSEKLEQKMNQTQESQEKMLQRHQANYDAFKSARKEKRNTPPAVEREDLHNSQQSEIGAILSNGVRNGTSSRTKKENPRAQKQYALAHESMVFDEAGVSVAGSSTMQNKEKQPGKSFGSPSSSMSSIPGLSTSNRTSTSVRTPDVFGKKHVLSLEQSAFDLSMPSPNESKSSNSKRGAQVSMSHDEMSPLVMRKNIQTSSETKKEATQPATTNRSRHVNRSRRKEKKDRSKDLPPLPEHVSVPTQDSSSAQPKRSSKWNNTPDKSNDLPPLPKHLSKAKWNDSPDKSNDLPPLPKNLSKAKQLIQKTRDVSTEEPVPISNLSTSHDEMSPMVTKQMGKASHTDQDHKEDFVEQEVIASKKIEFSEQSSDSHFEEADITGNAIAEISPPTPVPKKKGMRHTGGPFLDKSWQPSPIKPGGSFAIFDETTIIESRSNEEENAPVQMDQDDSSSAQPSQSAEDYNFMRVVAAIVIQTFFRRHLAYKLTCERYSAVLKIQRFLREAYWEKKRYRSLIMQQTTYQFYDLAAVQIQAAWRGWWVRDCMNVEEYCASTIQRTFRAYWARVNYKYDVYRIVIAQSVVRRFLAKYRLHKERKAAILIQSQWRVSIAKDKARNARADMLIVQSVKKKVRATQYEPELDHQASRTVRDNRKTMSRRPLVSQVPISHSERTLKTGTTNHRTQTREVHKVTEENLQKNGDLTQMNTDELIQKWQSRRSRHSNTRTHQLAEF